MSGFIYTDHITNDTFLVSDSLFLKPPRAKERSSHKDSSTDSINPSIQECINLMKSTRKFHLSSIQSKNYRIKTKQHLSMRMDANNDVKRYGKAAKEKLMRYLSNK